MNMRKYFTLLLIILLSTGLLAVSCSKQKAEIDVPLEEGKITADEKTGSEHVVSHDEPVWIAGTTFNKTSMLATIRHRTARIYQIYHLYEEQSPGLTGNVTLSFNIHPDGTTDNVIIKESKWSDPSGEAVTDSLFNHVFKWTFPPGAAKPINVTQPWEFNMDK